MERLLSKVLIVIEIMLAIVIALLCVLVIKTGKEAYSVPQILEISNEGEGTWYQEPIKLFYNYIPTDECYKKTLKKFVRGFRMVEGFFDTNEQLVKGALYCSTGQAQEYLQEKLSKENPFDKAKTVRIDVPENVIKVTKVTNNQWKVSWRERTYNSANIKIMEEEYEAVFHVIVIPHTLKSGEEQKTYNPMGIYIYDYDIDLLRKLM